VPRNICVWTGWLAEFVYFICFCLFVGDFNFYIYSLRQSAVDQIISFCWLVPKVKQLVSQEMKFFGNEINAFLLWNCWYIDFSCNADFDCFRATFVSQLIFDYSPIFLHCGGTLAPDRHGFDGRGQDRICLYVGPITRKGTQRFLTCYADNPRLKISLLGDRRNESNILLTEGSSEYLFFG